MNLDAYQAEVMRTANRGTYPDGVPDAARRTFDLMVWGLGVAGEAGEVADLIKKGVGHGHGVDREKLLKELGDVLWYVGALAANIGSDLSEVAAANVAKLRARYPSGFSIEASKAKADERRTGVERTLVPDVPCHAEEASTWADDSAVTLITHSWDLTTCPACDDIICKMAVALEETKR